MKKKSKLPIPLTTTVTKDLALAVYDDVLKPESRFDLYKRLKEAQYPQGGGGQYMQDPNSNEKVYIPTYQEVLTHYIADPKGWEVMVDAITKVWIDNKNGNHKTKESS